MAWFYGEVTVEEAMAEILKTALEQCNEKAVDGKVYIHLEADGSYEISPPHKAE